MSTPIHAEIVHAFTASLENVFEAATGVHGEIEPLGTATAMPTPPYMMVTIEVSGRVIGTAIWIFEPEVASRLAGRILSCDESLPYDSPQCRDALGELANMLVGNVTGALLDVGYPIELSTPKTEVASSVAQLSQRGLRLSIATGVGQVDLLLGLALR
jgi:CheY-specific phosphatase CheX